jgi:hypothetical protein
MRNKLLIATAVTVLLAATGLASAQDNHRGFPSGGRTPSPQASHAQPAPRAQAMPRAQPMQQPRMQLQGQNVNRAPTRMGQNELNRANRMEQRRGMAQNQQRTEPRRNLAQGPERRMVQGQGRPENRQSTAQVRENNRNLQLSSQQRNRIRQAVLAQGGAPRISRRDLGGINIRVGAAIPRNRLRFRPLPLPVSVVAIAPQWQGFLYILVGDEIVVLDPVTYNVVAILPA